MAQVKALAWRHCAALYCVFCLELPFMTQLYFYDLETWGADPKRDRIAQFAGMRTNAHLEPIEPAQTLYCQLAPDYLPDPEAVLITGILPQVCQQKGISEAEFTRKIAYEWLKQPDTCVVGYNNIRFDDEMLRYAFFRNFIEPYGREWQQQNSRWDLLDVVRACYALRPEGLQWPRREDGTPSFKLEDLAKANQLTHTKAHDALSDVEATIGLAKLIKQQQPRLFDYLFQHRSKQALLSLIDVAGLTPLVHVSGMYKATQGCISWVVPLAFHPTQKNAVICFDLQQSPELYDHATLDDLREWYYRPASELAEGEWRPALKLVHLNKSPVLAPAKTLSAERATELGIDRAACLRHLELLKNSLNIRDKMVQIVINEREFPAEPVAEYALYQGFISKRDQLSLQQLFDAETASSAAADLLFDDERLNQMWFRFKARNFPHGLSFEQQQRWRQYCHDRLHFGVDAPARTIDDFILKVENLIDSSSEPQHKLLQKLCSFFQ